MFGRATITLGTGPHTCPCGPVCKTLGTPCAVERDVRSGRGSIRASARARPPTKKNYFDGVLYKL